MIMDRVSRRDTLRGLAAGSFLALLQDVAVPARAQGESDVPFTDIPKTFNPTNPNTPTRLLDIRQIDGLTTPRTSFSRSTILAARRSTAQHIA